jgi:DNA-directed RNA polymerase subunit F
MDKNWKYKLNHARNKNTKNEFSDWKPEDFVKYIRELREIIETLSKDAENKVKNPPAKNYSEKDYKQSWSFPTKIAFLLTLKQKPLTAKEIKALLLKLDTHFPLYDKQDRNLTVTLNRCIKSGRFHKIKLPGIKQLYYALPEWMQGDGKVKEGFELFLKHFN